MDDALGVTILYFKLVPEKELVQRPYVVKKKFGEKTHQPTDYLKR